MKKPKRAKSPLFLLDAFSAEDIERREKEKDRILRYHWDLHCAFAYERNKIKDQIRTALLEATVRPYVFRGWQRQVRYKYSLTPLSPKGSLYEPGGRFNIPDINPEQIQPFPALYIAEDKETTMQEAGQLKSASKSLSGLELALIKKDSISIVEVHGKLESVIDLHHPNKLKPFLQLIKKFSLPENIIEEAKKLNVNTWPIQNMKLLIESLLEPDWRAWCMQFDVPANCQIFGQLVSNAGITGIVYPSKYTKKKCLAIYPQNFDT